MHVPLKRTQKQTKQHKYEILTCLCQAGVSGFPAQSNVVVVKRKKVVNTDVKEQECFVSGIYFFHG